MNFLIHTFRPTYLWTVSTNARPFLFISLSFKLILSILGKNISSIDPWWSILMIFKNIFASVLHFTFSRHASIFSHNWRILSHCWYMLRSRSMILNFLRNIVIIIKANCRNTRTLMLIYREILLIMKRFRKINDWWFRAKQIVIFCVRGVDIYFLVASSFIIIGQFRLIG